MFITTVRHAFTRAVTVTDENQKLLFFPIKIAGRYNFASFRSKVGLNHIAPFSYKIGQNQIAPFRSKIIRENHKRQLTLKAMDSNFSLLF